MGDVIEHVVDPVSVLRTVAEYLKPRGMIVLRTPNAASGYSRFSAALANLTRTAVSYTHLTLPTILRV